MKMPAIGMENANIHHRFAYISPNSARTTKMRTGSGAAHGCARCSPIGREVVCGMVIVYF